MRLKGTSTEQLKSASKTTAMASSLLVDDGNSNNNSSGSGSGSGGNGSTSASSSSVNNGINFPNSDDNKSGKYSMNNNNNNNEDSQSQSDDVEIRLKREALTQRKHELEMLLNEKSWMLQQIQKQESQILNGNYEYMNLNDILENLARQYKQEKHHHNFHHPQQHQQKPLHQQHPQQTQANTYQHHSTGSTAILRRKTTTGVMGMGGISKENQNILNNNNSSNNSNRMSEVSNRSSEYDNYPIANTINAGSSCGNLTLNSISSINMLQQPQQQQQQQQQMPMKQTMSAAKKRSTTTAAATSFGGYLQHMQQQQQLANDQLYLQQYLAEQQYLQQKITSYQQRQQQQQQQLVQQLQQHEPNSNIALASHDVISLYSVNSSNVATLRQQNVAPKQQPQQSTILQCDKYYLSPTHQSHSTASGCGFIKSSQSIKKYNSPAASPTATRTVTSPAIRYSSAVSTNLGSSTATLGINYDPQQYGTSTSTTPHHTLQHYHHAATASIPATHHQFDAISLAPSYAVSIDAAIGGANFLSNVHQQHQNMRWRSHTSIPTTISPLISPNETGSHLQQAHYHSHLGVDVAKKSQSNDMLAHVLPTAGSTSASINTLPTISLTSTTYFDSSTIGNTQQKDKLLDEISISSLNSVEGQKKTVAVKPKQWLESSLDGPIIRSTPTTEFGDSVTTSVQSPSQHQSLHKSISAVHVHPKHKLSSQSMSVGSSSMINGGSNATAGSSGGSVNHPIGTSRHYSMSKHISNAHRLALQDDTERYAKLSQSTSYLHSLESNNNSNSNDNVALQHHKHKTPLAYQYLPPKPAQPVAAQLTPPPPPRPTIAVLDKPILSPVAPALVAAVVAAANTTQNSSNNNNANNPTMIGPDIRIESPKNMTVVQHATFQPYKEVTKPFEMADFYKYSTKFRQKENTPTGTTDGGIE